MDEKVYLEKLEKREMKILPEDEDFIELKQKVTERIQTR